MAICRGKQGKEKASGLNTADQGYEDQLDLVKLGLKACGMNSVESKDKKKHHDQLFC